ncbi:DUF4357 domain-containing protein [Devosia indica]
MTETILGASASAGKCACTSFHTLDHAHGGLDIEGLARHWAIDYDVQIRILGTVSDTGSTIGDIIAELPGHPAPAAAIMALVEAGFLTRESGPITPHTRITLPLADQPAPLALAAPAGAGAPPSGKKTKRRAQLPATVAELESERFVPIVSVVNIEDRLDLPRFTQPAVYLGLKGKTLYPGRTDKGWSRVAAPHLKGYKKVAVLRDASGQLTPRLAAVAERILGLQAQALPGYRLAATLPIGAPVGREEYIATRLFVAEGLILAQRLGLGLIGATDQDLMAGASGPLDLVLKHDAVPEGQEYHLYASGVEARAVVSDGDWIVLPGSEVRKKLTPTVGAVVNSLRQEWLFSGVLQDEGVRYRLTEPVVFNTGTAAANFVLGSKGPNLAAWNGDGSSSLERMPLTP